jgi:hypothetical protein
MRTLRLRVLARNAGPKAARLTKLHTGNVWPVRSYGVPATGFAAEALHAARSQAAQTVLHKYGQCVHSVLQTGLGIMNDPEVQAIRQSLTFWVSFWRAAEPPMRERITKAWVKSLPVIGTQSDIRWNKVFGTMRALMASLLRIGWRIPFPNKWMAFDAHSDVLLMITDEGNVSSIMHYVAYAVRKLVLPKIERHWSGSGAIKGSRFDHANRHIKLLRNH